MVHRRTVNGAIHVSGKLYYSKGSINANNIIIMINNLQMYVG